MKIRSLSVTSSGGCSSQINGDIIRINIPGRDRSGIPTKKTISFNDYSWKDDSSRAIDFEGSPESFVEFMDRFITNKPKADRSMLRKLINLHRTGEYK